MKRKIYDRLLQWKREKDGTSALICGYGLLSFIAIAFFDAAKLRSFFLTFQIFLRFSLQVPNFFIILHRRKFLL